MAQNPFAALLRLKQEDLVSEFVAKFERYARVVSGLSKSYLMVVFLNRLKRELGAEVKLYTHQSLTTVIKKTMLIEEKNVAAGSNGVNAGGRCVTLYSNFEPTRTITVEQVLHIQSFFQCLESLIM